MNDNKAPDNSKRSVTSFRVRYFFPSIRPSYVSLGLIFVCGFLWLKIDMKNKRQLALENQLQTLKGRCRLHHISKKADEEATSRPNFTTVTSVSSKSSHLLFVCLVKNVGFCTYWRFIGGFSLMEPDKKMKWKKNWNFIGLSANFTFFQLNKTWPIFFVTYSGIYQGKSFL